MIQQAAHIILAHPKPDSLNAELARKAQTVLKNCGWIALTSDLYTMAGEDHPATRYYGTNSAQQDSELIQEEQNKIRQSCLTIVQFPLYWFQFPAILKSYMEQVWQPGFAYPDMFHQAPLAGRNVLFSVTTQSTQKDFSSDGNNGDFSQTLFPMATAFRFIGFNVLEPFIGFNVANQSTQKIEQLLQQFERHVAHIITT